MEPTSLQIGIRIVCEFQILRIGIVSVRQKVFATCSQIPEIFSSHYFLFLTRIYLSFGKSYLANKPIVSHVNIVHMYSVLKINIQ